MRQAPPRGAFVSRHRELLVLRRALDEAQNRHGQIVLVSGEAGIGKTRLAQELAASAASGGVTVLWGRCVQGEASPACWPWAQVVGAFAERAASRRFVAPRQHADAYASSFRHAPSGFVCPRTEIATCFSVSTRVREFVQRVALQATVLASFEDLHWADRGSLLLLELIAQELSSHRVLVVATYRDGEVPPHLAQTLGELARVGVTRVALSGLSAEDTGLLMAGISGQLPAHDMVELVHVRTAGNPFFVTEIARLPSADAYAVPENARAAISQRLSRLSRLANQILVVASVIGREFEFRVVAAVLSDAGEENLSKPSTRPWRLILSSRFRAVR